MLYSLRDAWQTLVPTKFSKGEAAFTGENGEAKSHGGREGVCKP